MAGMAGALPTVLVGQPAVKVPGYNTLICAKPFVNVFNPGARPNAGLKLLDEKGYLYSHIPIKNGQVIEI